MIRLKHLSPTKVATAVEKCMLRLRWELEMREQGIPLPTDYARLAGTAFHTVVEWALRERIEGRPIPSAADMADRYPGALEAQIESAKLNGEPISEDPEDPPDKIRAELLALFPPARAYLERVDPVQVELDVKVPLDVGAEYGGSVILWGRLDALLRDGRILDWKTTRDKVSANARRLDMQVAAYGWVDHRLHGRTESRITKVFFVRGKSPRVEEERYAVGEAERDFFERSAVEVWRAAWHGVYPPNTSSFWCSKDWCPFFGPCRGGA